MTLNIDLPDNLEAALNTKAQNEGLSAEGYAVRVLIRNLIEHEIASANPQPRRPISEFIAEVMEDAGPRELAKLPSDGASEHDHYIYGWPKRNQ